MAGEPKYYYHITQQLWSKRIKLYPQESGTNRADDEPNIARICVASTIEGCLLALGACLSKQNKTYVYRTVSKVIAKRPYSVPDAILTGEKWLIRPATFERFGSIVNENLPKKLFKTIVGDFDGLEEQAILKQEIANSKNWLIK